MESKKNSERRRIILNITPQTHVRTTQGDRWFFRIPRDKLRPSGLKRLTRIERYNQYKIDLLAEAKRKNFTLPAAGLSVVFFIPCPQSWSNKKKKLYHGTFHQSSPDIDNLNKAFFDSLVSEDKFVANISLTKRWVDFPIGWIELQLTDQDMQVLVMPPAKE